MISTTEKMLALVLISTSKLYNETGHPVVLLQVEGIFGLTYAIYFQELAMRFEISFRIEMCLEISTPRRIEMHSHFFKTHLRTELKLNLTCLNEKSNLFFKIIEKKF